MHKWLDEEHPVLRPANYHVTAPGEGYKIFNIDGYRILVINILGVIYMDPLENPIRCISRILDYYKGKYDFAALDIHAEATSEKIAIGRCFDSRISVVFGTHTHVQTADECAPSGRNPDILPTSGCAVLTIRYSEFGQTK